MSNENKPMTPVNQIDPATWQKIGRWLADQIHDREIDAEEIAAHEGPAFLPAMRGLAEHLMAGGQLPLKDGRWTREKADELFREDVPPMPAEQPRGRCACGYEGVRDCHRPPKNADARFVGALGYCNSPSWQSAPEGS